MAALARDALVRCAMVCGRRCSGAIRCDLASWFSQCLADDPANIAGNPDCSFRPRVPLILDEDVRVRRIVARTVIITVAALLVGGQVTDVRRPPHHVTAAVATLLLAAVLLVYSYGRFATMLISEYSAPRAFISRVTRPVLPYLDNDRPRVGMVVLRIPLLGQALRCSYSPRVDGCCHRSAVTLTRPRAGRRR